MRERRFDAPDGVLTKEAGLASRVTGQALALSNEVIGVSAFVEILDCLKKYGQRLDLEIAKETGVPLATVRTQLSGLAATGAVVMNSAAIFIALLFWGWLWGVWGMLLSVPIVVIVKVVSQHLEPLHPMAELLGD